MLRGVIGEPPSYVISICIALLPRVRAKRDLDTAGKLPKAPGYGFYPRREIADGVPWREQDCPWCLRWCGTNDPSDLFKGANESIEPRLHLLKKGNVGCLSPRKDFLRMWFRGEPTIPPYDMTGLQRLEPSGEIRPLSHGPLVLCQRDRHRYATNVRDLEGRVRRESKIVRQSLVSEA